MAKQKDSFIVYYEWESACEDLTDEQRGQLFMALFAYEKRGEVYTGKDPALRIAMKLMSKSLDINREKYLERCEKNRRNIQKRWEKQDEDAYHRIQNGTNDTDTEHEPEPVPVPEPVPETETEIEPASEQEKETEPECLPYPVLFFEQYMGSVSPTDRQEILDAVRFYGENQVLDAMQTAQRKGANSWHYVRGILNNWQRQGRRGNALQPRPPFQSYTPRDVSENTRQIEALLKREAEAQQKRVEESQAWMKEFLGKDANPPQNEPLPF